MGVCSDKGKACDERARVSGAVVLLGVGLVSAAAREQQAQAGAGQAAVRSQRQERWADETLFPAKRAEAGQQFCRMRADRPEAETGHQMLRAYTSLISLPP